MPAVHEPKRVRLAGLDAIEVFGPGDEATAVGAGPVAVILHGYGADMSDLAPLATVLRGPPGTRWIFPNGPVRVPVGPFWHGSAWFPIDLEALERAMQRGTARDLSGKAPEALGTSREAVMSLLAGLDRPLERVILGGFSQGAMLATELALHLPANPAGLLLWSGTILQEAVWRPKIAARAGLRFVQSHGRHDPLLPYAAAERLFAMLVEGGLDGRFVGFDGAHEIPDAAIAASNALLAGLA
jgi:phospholipase/carboxylesterase